MIAEGIVSDILKKVGDHINYQESNFRALQVEKQNLLQKLDIYKRNSKKRIFGEAAQILAQEELNSLIDDQVQKIAFENHKMAKLAALKTDFIFSHIACVDLIEELKRENNKKSILILFF